jgi:hypothetical protein
LTEGKRASNELAPGRHGARRCCDDRKAFGAPETRVEPGGAGRHDEDRKSFGAPGALVELRSARRQHANGYARALHAAPGPSRRASLANS